MKHRDQDDDRSLEKAKWVEEQVNRTLIFRFESSDILRKEAHTTLGWMYTIIVGSSGLAVSHLSKDQLWLAIPLGAAAMTAGVAAGLLIRGALMTKVFPSPGNIPSNIGTTENLVKSEAEMRLSEARGLELAVLEIDALNGRTAEAINCARFAVAAIPALTIILVAVLYCLFG